MDAAEVAGEDDAWGAQLMVVEAARRRAAVVVRLRDWVSGTKGATAAALVDERVTETDSGEKVWKARVVGDVRRCIVVVVSEGVGDGAVAEMQV